MKFWYPLKLSGGGEQPVWAEVASAHFVIYTSIGRELGDREMWTVTHSMTGHAAVYAPNRHAALEAAEALEDIDGDVWDFEHVACMSLGLDQKAIAVLREVKKTWPGLKPATTAKSQEQA
jgi:hypothetical protein